MPIRDFRELRCWQYANELRREAIAICDHPAAARDSRFCNGFKAAAGSVCRNLAEGFGRFQSAYIVQFFSYALASLSEVMDYVEECRQRGVVDDVRYQGLCALAERTRAATLRFQTLHKERATSKRGSSRARGR